MLKKEWGAKSNGKIPHLFIPSKTAALVLEFAVEDLPLAEHSDDNVNYNNNKKRQRTKQCCDCSYNEDKIET